MSFLHPTPTEEAFITAAASGNLTLVERFAYPERSGSNRRPVRTSIADRGTGRNALIAASRNGRLEMVEYLVSVLNCNVDIRDAAGMTAVAHTVLVNSYGCCETLSLTGGADVNIRDLTGKAPLHHAARRDGPSATAFIELIIGAGAFLDLKDCSHGWTPYVHRAASSGVICVLFIFIAW